MRLLNRRRGEISTGKLITPNTKKITFEDLSRMLIEDYRLCERKSLDRAEDAVEHLQEFFGVFRAIEIATDTITRYAVKRQAEGARPATIKYELSLLKRMFNLAIRAGKLIRKPYFPSISVRNTRAGFFEDSEFAAILEHVDADVAPVIEFAYCTGWRKQEILKLQWRQIDFKARTIRLEPMTTKNDEARTFPFKNFPRLESVILKQWERTLLLQQATDQIIPWVFHRDGKPIKDFRKHWRKACEESGVPGRYVHDFRRTAVRNLERAGVPRSVAMKLVGHKTESIYRRYAIVSESDLSEGVEKLAALDNIQIEPSHKIEKFTSRKVPAK